MDGWRDGPRPPETAGYKSGGKRDGPMEQGKEEIEPLSFFPLKSESVRGQGAPSN